MNWNWTPDQIKSGETLKNKLVITLPFDEEVGVKISMKIFCPVKKVSVPRKKILDPAAMSEIFFWMWHQSESFQTNFFTSIVAAEKASIKKTADKSGSKFAFDTCFKALFKFNWSSV